MAYGRTDSHSELEAEFEDEFEAEDENEAFLGGLASLAGSLLGEGEEEYEGEYEDEAEDELEGEYEDEFEGELEDEFEDESEDEDEAFLGGLANLAGSLLGEGEDEAELEEEAEYFWKTLKRGFKAALPLLKKYAIPALATAVAGPAGGMIARAVTSQLEGELEGEDEAELEAELESLGQSSVSHREAMAEYLAARAATAQSESEAEAFAGSAVTAALTERERADLERMLPALLQGSSVITKLLYADRRLRPAMRLMPGMVGAAARTLLRRYPGGNADPQTVRTVLAGSAQKVLGDLRYQSAAGRRHAYGLAHIRRHRRHTHPHGRGGYRTTSRGGYARHSGGHANGRRPSRPTTLHRRPTQTRTVSHGSPVARPPRGYVRVVTPVKIPARNGSAARTVRVVSDVRVPRGAVPAGRPVATRPAPRRR